MNTKTSDINHLGRCNMIECGLDRIEKYISLIRARRVGVIVNHTSVTTKKEFITDVLVKSGADIRVIFTPEHGLFGKTEAGKHTTNKTYKNIKVVSLYSGKRSPDRKDLEGLDLLVYDIQDVACRFYTYISTMAMAMEKAAEQGIDFLVLDRPCLRGGIDVSGPVLKKDCKSFVGYLPLPVSYAMTPGELALAACGENWLAQDSNHSFSPMVIPLSNWRRGFPDTEDHEAQFIPPSPNLPNLKSVIAYPGMCLFEATNISEGRGTQTPFLKIGAPWASGTRLAKALNENERLKGVRFLPCTFTPHPIPGKSSKPKYSGTRCEGISLLIKNPAQYKSLLTGLETLHTFLKLWPDKTEIREHSFNLLSGNRKMLPELLAGKKPQKILDSYLEELKVFQALRKKHLLYD